MKIDERYINTNKTAKAAYLEIDSCYAYKCPICGEIIYMQDLTEKEEHSIEKGETVYYQCDFCDTITEVTCED